MIKTLKLFQCSTNSDRTEGRGYIIPVCYFEIRKEAEKLIHNPLFYKKYGVMGHDNGSVSEIDLIILNKAEEFIGMELEQAKISGLNKLSDLEKEALGLK